MTEILTESFCERCGTRYTFEPVVNRRKQLSAIGTLGRGIRHFVSDPGSTLDESMAVARSESEQRSTASALEAFHRTFNFCLSCRQYTCADCWNTVEGRCLSCAPTPDAAPPITRVDMAVGLPPMDLAVTPAPVHVHDGSDLHETAQAGAAEAPADAGVAKAEAAAAAEAAALADQAAVAEADARVAAAAAAAEAEAAERAAREAAAADAAARAAAELAARDAADASAAAEAREAAEAAEAAARAAETASAEAEASRAAEAEARAVADALAQAEAAAMAAMIEAEARAAAEAAERETAELAARAAAASATEDSDRDVAFEPGLNLDDQIAAYELDRASLGAEMDPEPGVAAATDAPESEPVAAEPVAAEPVAAEPVAAERPAASIEPIPTAIGQPIPASAVEGPLRWPEPGVAAASFEPAWPNVSTGETPAPNAAATTADPVGPGAGLPAADTPPMPIPAHACPSCGLSLSASARFCRRCGTPQQVNAPN